MSREQERIRRRMESNPVAECNKVRQKYCPELFKDFAQTEDPKHPGYIDYTNGIMLGTMFYKGIAGLGSMQSMIYEFNKADVAKISVSFMLNFTYPILADFVNIFRIFSLN